MPNPSNWLTVQQAMDIYDIKQTSAYELKQIATWSTALTDGKIRFYQPDLEQALIDEAQSPTFKSSGKGKPTL